MKPETTRRAGKGQVVVPKPAREQFAREPDTRLANEIIDAGAARRALPVLTDPIDSAYGCLKSAPQDPLANLDSRHRAEIEADERWQGRVR